MIASFSPAPSRMRPTNGQPPDIRRKRGRSSPTEPEPLICPITKCMFRDPVIIKGSELGLTYERDAIKTWFDTQRASAPRCPMRKHVNGFLTDGTTLIPNMIAKQLVDGFLDANPGYVPDGWSSRIENILCTEDAETLDWLIKYAQTFLRIPNDQLSIESLLANVTIEDRKIVRSNFKFLPHEKSGTITTSAFKNMLFTNAIDVLKMENIFLGMQLYIELDLPPEFRNNLFGSEIDYSRFSEAISVLRDIFRFNPEVAFHEGNDEGEILHSELTSMECTSMRNAVERALKWQRSVSDEVSGESHGAQVDGTAPRRSPPAPHPRRATSIDAIDLLSDHEDDDEEFEERMRELREYPRIRRWVPTRARRAPRVTSGHE